MDKIKDFFNYEIKNDKKRLRLLIILGVLIICLIFISSIDSSGKNKSELTSKADYSAYNVELEKRLQGIISSINGVGKCRVMITLENTNESVYAINKDTRKDEYAYNSNDEYVIYNSSDGESPVLIKEYFPRVQGVSVVCSGGGNELVKEQIINTVSSLFNITTNRISVSKINE